MKHGTIQTFLEAAAGTAHAVFGEQVQRVAPRGGAAWQSSGVHFRFGSGEQIRSGRARPHLRLGRVVQFLPAAVDRRGCGRRRQSAGR